MFLIFLFLVLINSFVQSQAPIDLSYGFDATTLLYPAAGSPFIFTRQFIGTINGIWYSTNDFKTSEHCGTHLDAPYHFNPHGRTVGYIPVERLVTKGILIDAEAETNDNVNYTLPASKLDDWVRDNGPLPDNCVILVKFGWSKRWPDRIAYLGPSDTNLQYPGLSEEAAAWIVNSGKVVGIGVDTASCDPGNTKSFPVHVMMCAQDKYILENVKLIDPLPPIFDIIVMPMKITNGTGAPCRVVAIPPCKHKKDKHGKYS